MMPYKSFSLSFNLGFYFLLTFLFSRTILTALETYSPFPIHIIVPVIFTYALIFFIFLNIRKFKVDSINILIIIFCFYVIFSALWGSTYQNIIRVISPFVAFISVRTFADKESKIRVLFWAIFFSYILPITISSFLIFFESSIESVSYFTGLNRYQGVFYNAHALSHSMVFFSFITLFLYFDSFSMKSIFKWMMFAVLILSYYNIYNSYVRNGYFAIILFWSTFTFLYNKKYWVFLILLIFFLVLVNYDQLSTVFWQTDELNIDHASSGRFTIWEHNINLFINQDIFKKICGWGLIKYEHVIGKKNFPASSHNDFLQLLMEVGIVGLVLYMSIIFFLIYDVLRIKNNNGLKNVYLSAIITFLFISMVTNGWVFRIESGQLFWSFLGGAYFLKDKSKPLVSG